MTSIVITGHRDLSPDDNVKIRMVMSVLLAKPHISKIYFGGARGTDLEALKAAVQARKDNKPELIVVVPDTTSDQPLETQIWIKKADKVIELKNKITSDNNFSAYHTRNEYMVDAAVKDSNKSSVVAFWDGRTKSGTSSCISYARKKDLHIEVIKVEGKKV